MGTVIDLTGERFGLLTVTKRSEFKDGKNSHWDYVCDCGNKGHSHTSRLRKGQISCGCATIDAIGKRSLTHGHAVDHKVTSTYRCHRAMLARCIYPSQSHWDDYGGRGITVCDRWRYGEGALNGFECFLTDMGEKPDGLTIDRRDNDGNYEPDNCRWATQSEQMFNTRATKFKPSDRDAVVLAFKQGKSKS